MIKAAASAKLTVRHNICQPLALNTMSRRVPTMWRHIQRIHPVITHAQPMMVMAEI
jgi:hypothetical protein